MAAFLGVGHHGCLAEPEIPVEVVRSGLRRRAVVTTDKEERHALWNEMLAPIFDGPDDPNYGVVVVEPYRIEYWVPGEFTPQVWEKE